jgi:polysaccharide export outer membrane protein
LVTSLRFYKFEEDYKTVFIKQDFIIFQLSTFNKMQKNRLVILIILLLVITVSCVPKRQLSYFNDVYELDQPSINARTQKVIMPFDKLYVKVVSIDPQTNQIFNSTDEMRSFGASSSILGYLVDEGGNINFPFVGNIKVGTLTTAQAAEKIQNALTDYVSSSTSVVVKYVDSQVTVIGEVQRQGVYPFSQDKLNIYEALGLAGGLTRYGDRKNIILVRNEGDKIMHYRLNLSDSKIATKDLYYILPNDVIVIEPLNAISSSYSNLTYTTILTSVTTLIALLLFIGVQF